jgi:uncharacterized protein (TIGR02217 family)
MGSAFHEVRFPTGISRRASGGPERRTEIVALASRAEERNSRWADSRRRYDAGYGIRSLDEIHAVIAFFEERRGRLHGFRWKDHADWKSCPPLQPVDALDQRLAESDGAGTEFQLVKRYGSGLFVYARTIAKPVKETVRVAVDGRELPLAAFTIDATTGRVRLATAPRAGALITAGFAFDVPVRFDTDRLVIDLEAFAAGRIPSVPVVEIKP